MTKKIRIMENNKIHIDTYQKDFRFHSTFKKTGWMEDESTVFGQEYLFRMVRGIKFI